MGYYGRDHMAETRKRKSAPAPKLSFRLDPALVRAAGERAKDKGHPNVSAYFRSLVEKDLKALPEEDRLSALERIIGANHHEVTRLLRSMAVVQRGQYMLFDAAVKAILSYLPDVPADAAELVTARGKARYERVVRVAEQGSVEALEQLAAQLDRAAAQPPGKRK